MEENASKVYADRASSALTDPLLAVTAAGSGTSLFVINLCASIAPVQVAGKTIPGFENYKLYQVARVEDGRTRHRLRLGFFPSEADAEPVLAAVRDNYPTAFIACLSDDDRRYARGYLPDVEATASWKRPIALVAKPAPAPASVAREPATPAAATKPASVAPAPVAAAPARVAAAAPVKAAVAPTAKAAPVESAIELDWEPETKPAAIPSQPEQKIAAKRSAEEEIELSWDPPALQTPAPAASKAPAVSAAAAQTVAPLFKTEPVIKARPAQGSPAAEVKKPAKPAEAPRIELTLESAAAPTPSPAVGKQPVEPFHVGKGADIPTTALSLESTNIQPAIVAPSTAPKPAAKAPAAPSPAKTPVAKTSTEAPASAKPAAPVAKPTAPIAKPAVSAPVSAPLPWVAAKPDHNAARPGPELDSTQTIRALTNEELNDDEKWFSIQLVVSEQPVNLDAMPHLDIFEAYRVYSIANAGSGKIVYSLRLGFFREEVSANAVGGYLKTFFPSPSVVRISTAEQLRFKDAPAPKATAIAAAKNEATVVELTQARDRKPTIPMVTMEVAAPAADRSPTGSFKASATGSYKVNASGRHKALKPAAKTSPPATRRSAPISKTSSTGRHKALQPKRSLQEQLLDEARDVQLSESAIRRLPKNDSLLSRLVGKLTK